MTESIIGCLRLISGAETLTLDPTEGTELICRRNDVFQGSIGTADFTTYGCNVKGKPTKAMNVQVYEMIKSGYFTDIYDGLGVRLDELCLEQDQIVQFVTKYPQWLRTHGYSTFFLLKVGDEFFVVYVSWQSGRLNTGVRRFSYRGRVWFADECRRFVLPELIRGI